MSYISTFLVILIGGVNNLNTALFILMIVDYITGVMNAVAGKSTKTKDGRLSSYAGLRGIFKKIMEFACLIVSHQLERAMNISGMCTVMATLLCGNEVVSILENVARGGVKLPQSLIDKISSLFKGGDEK